MALSQSTAILLIITSNQKRIDQNYIYILLQKVSLHHDYVLIHLDVPTQRWIITHQSSLSVMSRFSDFSEFSDPDVTAQRPLKHKELRRAGLFIMLLSVIFLFSWLYVVFISWWQPGLSNWFVDALRENNYYILLLPVIVPTVLAFAWINWLGMQFFKRNSYYI